MSNFLGSPELRKDMDLSARNKICSSFDINLLCSYRIEIYSDLISLN